LQNQLTNELQSEHKQITETSINGQLIHLLQPKRKTEKIISDNNQHNNILQPKHNSENTIPKPVIKRIHIKLPPKEEERIIEGILMNFIL